jgi:hypothetical protein
MPKTVICDSQLDPQLFRPVGSYNQGVIATGTRTLHIAGRSGPTGPAGFSVPITRRNRPRQPGQRFAGRHQLGEFLAEAR